MNRASGAGQAHVIGAGLAGLAAAVALASSGRNVRLYEASGHAGGRCRSYFDAELGCRIDNGNHLLLAGNRHAMRYLDRIGARETVEGPAQALFPFVDAATGRRWVLRPNRGRLPWWVLRRSRRVPQTRAVDYFAAVALRRAHPTATVGEALGATGTLFTRLWEPLAVAALNTTVAEGSARLFWRVVADTLGRGGAACRPLVPREGLSETFVDPALATLRRGKAEIRFLSRLRALEFAADRVTALVFDDGALALGRQDCVVLATPAAIAARLVPGLIAPDAYSPILNAHFRCSAPPGSPLFVGVIGGAAEWVFRKPDVLSVTVSAARPIIDHPVAILREMLWRDVALAFGLAANPAPPVRIVKERRATFLASPAQLLRRPAAVTRWRNLLLAGDYTDTGLPATIEGAIGSGFTAARLASKGGERRRACGARPARRGGSRTDPEN